MVRCRDGSLYTGIAKDVAARVKTHNAGKGSAYARSRLPVALVHQEKSLTHSQALLREAAIKALHRREKENVVARRRRLPAKGAPKTRRRRTAVFLLSLLCALPSVRSSERQERLAADRRETRVFISLPGRAVLGFYRRYAGPTIQSRCPMQPRCSSYSETAFQSRGPFLGTLLTGDRLLRCGHDLNRYPRVRTAAGRRYEDLVPGGASPPDRPAHE
jgi:putative endonuclease